MPAHLLDTNIPLRSSDPQSPSFQITCDCIADIFPMWRKLVTDHSVCGKRAHDARLVAVMLAHRISSIVTLNAEDFRSFKEITVFEPGVSK
jgi:predicted nucleic acid-binding protein